MAPRRTSTTSTTWPHNRELPGLYSPFLVVLLYPLALLPEMAAYRVFFAVNVGCVVGVALIMQSAVRSFEARTAIALAPVRPAPDCTGRCASDT